MLSSLRRRKIAAPRRVAVAAALAATMLTAAACSDDDDEEFGVVGNYQLTGVASASAPSIFVNPQGQTFPCGSGFTCEFQSGSITLNETGNAFTMSVQGLQRANGQPAGTGTQISFVSSGMQTGTWAQDGSVITFTPSASGLGTFQGTLSGGNQEMRVPLTLSGGGQFVLRFEQ